MSTNSDSFISEILKLYDKVEELKILNNVQLTNALAPSNVFVSDIANMESFGSDSEVKEVLQPLRLVNNAKESSIECFQQLQSHLSLLLVEDKRTMGFVRAFATLFGYDLQDFSEIMILNLNQLQQQLD